MLHQKEKFTPCSIFTEYVSHELSVQLVFITPESNCRYRSMLLTQQYQEKLVAIVIDEAHYIKTW